VYDAVPCSFCGRGYREVSYIVAGPGVAICWDCASIAQNACYSNSIGPLPDATKRVIIPSVLQGTEKLAPAQLKELGAALAAVAHQHGCHLLSYWLRVGYREMADFVSFDVAAPLDGGDTALVGTLTLEARGALGLTGEHWFHRSLSGGGKA